MIKVLLRLLVLPPDLLKAHAQGYADLAREAWTHKVQTLQYRWTLYAISAASMLMAMTLGGVALLLWSSLPLNDARHAWILPALPSVLLFISGGCWAWARSLRARSVLKDLQEQIQLDILTLRESQTP